MPGIRGSPCGSERRRTRLSSNLSCSSGVLFLNQVVQHGRTAAGVTDPSRRVSETILARVPAAGPRAERYRVRGPHPRQIPHGGCRWTALPARAVDHDALRERLRSRRTAPPPAAPLPHLCRLSSGAASGASSSILRACGAAAAAAKCSRRGLSLASETLEPSSSAWGVCMGHSHATVRYCTPVCACFHQTRRHCGRPIWIRRFRGAPPPLPFQILQPSIISRSK